MTVYKLCRRLREVLPKSIIRSLYFSGLLNTVQRNNRDVFIESRGVHESLKQSISRVRLQSAKTITQLQEGIDLIEGKSQ